MIRTCIYRVFWCLGAMALVLCAADAAAAQPQTINQTSCFGACTPPGVVFLQDILVDCQAPAPDNSIGRALAMLADRNGPNRIRVSGTCQQFIAIAGFNRLVIEGMPGATITRGWNITNSQLIALRSLTFDLATATGGPNGQTLNLTGADVTFDAVTVKNAQFNHGVVLNASRLGFGPIAPSLITTNTCSGIYVGAGSLVNVANVTISSNGHSGCGHLGKQGIVAEKGGAVNLQNFVTLQSGARQDANVDITGNFESGILMESGTTINTSAEGGNGLIHVFNHSGVGIEVFNASGDIIGRVKLDGNAPGGVPEIGIPTPVQLLVGGNAFINIGGGAEVLGGLAGFAGKVIVGNGGGMTITGGLTFFWGAFGIDAGENSIDTVTCDHLSWMLRFDTSSTIGPNTCATAGPAGTGIQSITAGSGISSTGGQTPTLSLDSAVTDARYLQLTGGTLTGGLTAPSFSGDGAGLTNLTPANLSAGTAGINISGNAATAANATNAAALGGVLPASYARRDVDNAFTGNQSVTGNISATGSLSIGSGSPITKHISASYAITVPSLKPNTCTNITEPLVGAVAGSNNAMAVGVPNSVMTQGGFLMFQAWESAADTITIRICNVSPNGPASRAASDTIRVDLWKH